MNKTINIAVVSDIHLSHKRNETDYILKNLEKAFPDNAQTAELDLIVLAGDVFDGLISLPDEFISLIDFWILYMLRLCKKHDILLRVLEGTPSHDWKQSERFVTLNIGARIECDLKYIQKLEIEYIERFDINILYVPDEWDEKPSKTLEQVRELMILKSLKQVDFAIMHGAFEYQLPEIVKAPKHDSKSYLEIVKYLIFIGHIHVFSQLERIFAQGSFDRLAHAEEAPKGHLRATVEPSGEYRVIFIENIHARRFITIELTDLDLDQSLELIESRLIDEDIPDNSFIRIACSKEHPLLGSMDQLIRRWPLMNWSKLVRNNQHEATLIENELSEDIFIPISITKDNIVDLVMKRLTSKTTDSRLLTIAQRMIEEIK